MEPEFKPRFRGSTRGPGVNGRRQTPGVAEKWGFDVMLTCLLGTLEHLQWFAMKDEFVLFGFFISNLSWTNTSMRYSKNEFLGKWSYNDFWEDAAATLSGCWCFTHSCQLSKLEDWAGEGTVDRQTSICKNSGPRPGGCGLGLWREISVFLASSSKAKVIFQGFGAPMMVPELCVEGPKVEEKEMQIFIDPAISLRE